jgi:hypothetical protein
MRTMAICRRSRRITPLPKRAVARRFTPSGCGISGVILSTSMQQISGSLMWGRRRGKKSISSRTVGTTGTLFQSRCLLPDEGSCRARHGVWHICLQAIRRRRERGCTDGVAQGGVSDCLVWTRRRRRALCGGSRRRMYRLVSR